MPPQRLGVPHAATPRILAVVTSPHVMHGGDAVRWTVRTTPDVVGVSAHVLSYSIPFYKQGPGSFALGFIVPNNIPFFFHHTYGLAVTARSQSGATANATVDIDLQ